MTRLPARRMHGGLLPLLLIGLLLLDALALALWPELSAQQREAGLAHRGAQRLLAADSALDAGQRWVCSRPRKPLAQTCVARSAALRLCRPAAVPGSPWPGATQLPGAPGPLLRIDALDGDDVRLRARADAGAPVLQRDLRGFGPDCQRLRSQRLLPDAPEGAR